MLGARRFRTAERAGSQPDRYPIVNSSTERFLDVPVGGRLNQRMPSANGPLSADDDFAKRLFRPVFHERVERASWPIFPKLLVTQADEIIDQALQRAYEKRDQYRGESEDDLLAWVLVILRNLTRDILRSWKGRPLLRPVPENLEDKNRSRFRTTPDEELGDEIPSIPLPAQAWALTAGSILQLISEEDRDVLLLRLGHGLSVRETAELLSTPDKPVTEAAVKMRQGRAIRRITELGKKLGLGAVPRSRRAERPEEGKEPHGEEE